MNLQDLEKLVADNKISLDQAYFRVYKNVFIENNSLEEFHATFTDPELAQLCMDKINTGTDQFATCELVIPGRIQI